MQEEVENRSVTLAISAAKLTGRLLKAAIAKYLASRRKKKIAKSRDSPVIAHGKQTVKELVGQNQGVSNIEVTDSNIKCFERVARKYGVDYAIKRDSSVGRFFHAISKTKHKEDYTWISSTPQSKCCKHW